MSLKICIPAIAAFLLAACGGDDNKASDPDPSAEADFVVDTFDDLSVCIDKREGATAYVKDEEKDYICTDGDWAIDTNADTRKKSSSSKDKAKSSSSRHCKDSKDEANSNSNFAGQKTAWEYLSPNIDYGEMVDDRDCQTYKTVRIGGQVWMAENLNYKVDSSFCYNDSAEYCEKYGRLYMWTAAVDTSEEDCGYGKICGLFRRVRGVCPEGWHLPDNAEWRTLFTAVGGEDKAGKMLRSQMGWGDGDNGLDAYGFSACPAGYMYRTGRFYDMGHYAHFWSATEDGSDGAYSLYLNYGSEDATLMYDYKNSYYSVRCLNDDSNSGSSFAGWKTSWNYLNPDIYYGEMVDDRDGQIYKTVKIGDQVWMAENLNYESGGSSCGGGHDFQPGDCSKYGRLYIRFDAVGVCPEGWHLPDNTEWNALFAAVGGKEVAGKALRSQKGWVNDGNGPDVYGFSALAAGNRGSDGLYNYEDFNAYFWSASEDYSNNVNLFYNDVDEVLYVREDDRWKNYAYAVRCLKDDSNFDSSPAKLSSSSCGDCKDDAKSSSSFAGPKIAWDYLNPDIDYGEMVDDRDGQIYKTVKIGDQVWMAENMNYTMDSSFCFFAEHCSKYGDYYTWESAVAACPKGWHLPDTAEWNTLFTEVGGTAKAGMMLKTQTDWSITTDTEWLNDSVSTNAYGFSALPAGSRGGDGNILYGNDAYFWSATDNGRNAYYCYMLMRERDHKRADLGLREKYYGLSVRCIQD
jgi:Fibrobacter succinogenes major domain (Fib_succ_major).